MKVLGKFKPIPKGVYEVFVTGQKAVKTPKGTLGTEITFIIRDDIEQPAKGRLIWNTFWHTEKGQKVCNDFMKAVGKPEELKFKTREEWAEWPQGKVLKIEVYQKEWTSQDGFKSGVENKIGKYSPSKIEETTEEYQLPSDDHYPF